MPVGGEVIVQARKVVGSAQLRAGDAFLQHGSMLLEDDQQLVRELAGVSGGAPKEAALASLIGVPVAFSDAAAAVRAAAEALFEDVELSEGLPGRVSAGVAGHAGQFQSPEWTWAR
jgi:lipoate-protein ligase A